MADQVRIVAGQRVLCCAAAGRSLGAPDDAVDLVAAASSAGADVVLLPVERLDPRFFDPATGLAGGFVQKLVNYGLRLAVLGDIPAALSESRPLREFVRESNRGRQICFVGSDGELEERLRIR